MMLQRMSPWTLRMMRGAEDLGSAEDRAVDGALIAADDKEIGMCLLTIAGSTDEV
jgi:hypothetical protein